MPVVSERELFPHRRFCREDYVDPILHDPLIPEHPLDLVYRLTRDFIVGTRAFSIGTRAIESPTTAVIDNYDAQSLTAYSGSTGNYDFVTTPSRTGASLRHNVVGYDQIVSTGGLPHYPEQGDEVYIYLQTSDVTNTDSAGVDIAYQDQSNNYWGRMRFFSGGPYQLQVEAFTGGSTTASNTDNLTNLSDWPDDVWNYLRFRWDDGGTFGGSAGDITLEAFDNTDTSIAGPISINDTSLTAPGGIRVQGDMGAAGNPHYYEDFEITNR